MRLLASRLRGPGALERVMRERGAEPLHLNLLSVFIALFGGYRSKVRYDLAYRQYTAFCLLDAADRAATLGIKRISVLEFGVASGAGLINICENAAQVTRTTGIGIDVFGFDTGSGLPPPRSYRDHPELYQAGDYPMDFAALRARLPENAKLVLGDIASTVPKFLNEVTSPIGYIALDVDYYWSAVEALKVLTGPPELYLPLVNLYLDDSHDPYHNPACGEMLACAEFNEDNRLRQIFPYTALSQKRLFKAASWISKIYAVHVLDHEVRTRGVDRAMQKTVVNPYLQASAKVVNHPARLH